MQNYRRAFLPVSRFLSVRTFSSSDRSDGSIRSAGGSFAKKEQAQEDQYFRKLTQEQLKGLKDHHEEEIEHHEMAIKQHEDAIKRHKRKIETHSKDK
eukprot:m.306637 g.306637  ORF g.306637 m.306637 type:complete len:97 (+) comp41443_c0_seq1:80-370(+)